MRGRLGTLDFAAVKSANCNDSIGPTERWRNKRLEWIFFFFPVFTRESGIEGIFPAHFVYKGLIPIGNEIPWKQTGP